MTPEPIETAPPYGSFLIWLPVASMWWPAYGLGRGTVVSNAHGTVNIGDRDRFSPVATHWMLMPLPPPNP